MYLVAASEPRSYVTELAVFCLKVMTLIASKQGNQVSEPWWVGSRRPPDASGMKQ